MSVRVNLLPQATRARAKAGRQRLLVGGLAALLVLGMAAASVVQRGVRSDVEFELAAAQSDLTTARGEVAALAMFADLENELAIASALVTEALGDQATLAGVLQDLVLVLPADTSITDLTVDLTGVDAAMVAPDGADDVAGPRPVGTLTLTGETLTGIAPGVERVLIRMDMAGSFSDVHVASAATDEEEITTFQLDLVLGPELLTGTYGNGTTEVLQ